MRHLYLGIAWIMVGLGLIGVVLPGLPFTPFIVAAGFFGAKGSQGFEERLVNSKWYQKNVADTLSDGGMKVEQKMKILVVATVMIMIAFYFSSSPVLRWILGAVIVVKYSVFIFVIPNKKDTHND